MLSVLARVGLLVGLLTSTVLAQNNTQAPPCSTPEYRQFDFWIGEWDIFEYNAGQPGAPQGRSRITAIFGGCTIQEEYLGDGTNVTGKSLNSFWVQDRQWHQFYSDRQGQVIMLAGKLEGNTMLLQQEYPSSRNPSVIIKQRIAWTKLDDNRVRQRWELSTDGGNNWQTLFDGLYIRKR